MLTMMGRARELATDDRGDVPGWVLITMMTAALVVVIWGSASGLLGGLVQDALDAVSFK
ncbi:hypothetical protein [Microbacterium gorillae]|uniref:hypothetical protein n=1 Tax=Microbacterium gorillae TaxID=1231063 RepID=UPI000B14069A|nr:hypothetical protein [Microbacterium gorillae]